MGLKFRRGTTAQKSGSLAFGEPYVNTTLGTLQIGGETGDITLGASGTGSAGLFSSISGSGLDITGNANIAGNLTLGGELTIGNQTSDTVNVVASLSSSLIPSVTNVFDLGSATKIWRDLYISTGSIKIINPGTGTVVGTITSNASGEVNTGTQNVSGSLNVSGALNMTGSIIPGATNAYDLGSPTKQFRHLYISTGSLYMNGVAILSSNATDLTLTTDAGQSLKLLETAADTITLQTAEGNIALNSTGAGDIILDPTTGVIALKGTTTLYSGNKILSSDGNAIQFGNSVAITGSLTTTTDLTVGGNLTVNGTTTTIDSTNINIGDNIIVLNGTVTTNGGIYVKDGAGASTSTGSLLWDTTNDKWIAGTLGNEIGILRVGGDSVVSGSSQITYASISSIPAGIVSGSSQITYASISSIPGGIVSGSSQTIANLPVGTISGSSQVVGSSITTNTITVGSTAIALGGTATTIAGLTSVTSTGFTGALTGNASTATTAGTVTTAAQSAITSVGTLTSLTVSGATATGALTVTGAVTATGDITAFFTSDKRHKNNIQTIPNALEKVSKLNGVTWEWNDDVNEVTKSTPKTGLIAQEVQEVLPEVVKTRDDGFLALDYSKMMGLMVEAIKEQQQQIEKLRMDLDNYECKCDNCKSK
jgi:hypothetical protein